MSEDTYSNKDSNKNRNIDLRQSRITTAIIAAAVVIIGVLAAIYYDRHNPFQAENASAEPEPPAIVSDMSHPYDETRPPYKQ